jgi:pimeloyl-ACP methyl ester carboxylesterase
VEIEAVVQGSGPDVVLLPSAGRGAEDFAALQADLTKAGFRSLAVNFRGAGRSRGSTETAVLHDVVEDVARVVVHLCKSPVHVVGHALGNCVARAVASDRPDLVKTVATMPAGGHNIGGYPLSPEVARHFPRCHDMTLSPAERLESLGVVFFAAGNHASSWLEGWYPATSWVARAMQQSNPERWWRGGNVPILIMQPLQDAMLPTHAGRELATALGLRAQYVEIPRCGHAILPEQPDLIAANLVGFLRAHQ